MKYVNLLMLFIVLINMRLYKSIFKSNSTFKDMALKSLQNELLKNNSIKSEMLNSSNDDNNNLKSTTVVKDKEGKIKLYLSSNNPKEKLLLPKLLPNTSIRMEDPKILIDSNNLNLPSDYIKKNIKEIESKENIYPISFNPAFRTEKGLEEILYCRKINIHRYDRCSYLKSCNFCSANPGCSWCDENKTCIPVELDDLTSEFKPLCNGECLHLLDNRYCHKSLFEIPDILLKHSSTDLSTTNQIIQETNFSNYKDAVKEYRRDKLAAKKLDIQNTDFLKLKKNIKLNINLNNQNNENTDHNKDYINLIERKEKKLLDYDRENKNISNALLDGENISKSNINIYDNDNINRINDINKAFSEMNKLDFDNELNISKHESNLIHDDMIDLNEKMNVKLQNMSKEILIDDIKTKTKKIDENPKLKINEDYDGTESDFITSQFESIKNEIPNYELPQFAHSKLEDGLYRLKKQKLLLLLRGFKLNEPISKHHLPIYRNIKSGPEEEWNVKDSESNLSDKNLDLNRFKQKNDINLQKMTSKDIDSVSKIDNIIKKLEKYKENSKYLKK